MELHLIRHPRPDVPPGVCYGQSDVGLAESADAVAARLRPILPERFALHASPLARARLLAVELGTPVLDDRLKEMHFGEWELRPYAELGPAIDTWATDPLGFRAPGGESAHDMSARVLQWLDALLAPLPADPVVVVAHGGPLRAIAGHLLGLPPERWLGLDFACGHATRIDVEEWGVVLKWFNR
ncbi:alpha-ribazole phosphatase family protein [Aromatoleum toluolicum]|uniref:Phosphoglycerate mutase n=1 Tax=Aromatoleum toluolicum TaxID=90060 RepID=A0ABX1NN58_9RHOO|nr:alpha-ribazole phosphatase family protein [Aromatoleum toluolicum]NMG00580.1 alpha-ribazole phosphatase family protein [Aromatoleum toluolicum]